MSDDRRFAVVARTDVNFASMDLWHLDLDRGVSSRLTVDPRWDQYPALAPDGRRLAYRSDDGLTVLDIGTRSTPEVVLEEIVRVSDWSPDGRLVVFAHYPDQRDTSGTSDILALDIDSGSEPFPVVATSFSEYGGRVSPDGRFLAYVSDETGRPEVWVASFPGGERPQRVSREGGSAPRFRADGRELFYVSAANEAVSVPLQLGETLELGEPQVLWAFDFRLAGTSAQWEVFGDGDRFLVIANSGIQRNVEVVLNWPLMLEQ